MRSWRAPGGVCGACGGCGQGTRGGAWSRRAGPAPGRPGSQRVPGAAEVRLGGQGGPRPKRGSDHWVWALLGAIREKGAGPRWGGHARPGSTACLSRDWAWRREGVATDSAERLLDVQLPPELGLQWEVRVDTPEVLDDGGGSAGAPAMGRGSIPEAGTRPPPWCPLGLCPELSPPRCSLRPCQGPPPPGSARGTPAPPTSAPGRVSSALEEPGAASRSVPGEGRVAGGQGSCRAGEV